MKKIICSFLNIIFGLFKINDKKIVFASSRDLIDGNTKAVYDYIIENNITDFDIIWLVSRNTDVSPLRNGDYVYYKTLKSYYHLATAKYWIMTQSMGILLKKKPKQVYIQLWHGNGAMKFMGYDTDKVKSRPEVSHVKEWDYYIANDELDAEQIISSTGYKGKIEILGMACFDNTLKLSKDLKFRNKILLQLGIKKEDCIKTIVLYAPTFRDFDLNKDVVKVPIEKLANLNNVIILLRLHPLVRKKVNVDIFKYDNLVNACDYSDASDLLAVCDVLITDYSSIFYQYSPLNRPIIFYPYDYDDYVKLRGGFYLDYEKDLPGSICYNQDELFNELKKCIDSKKISDNQKKFNEHFNYLADGYSSKRFVDKLIKGDFSNGR